MAPRTRLGACRARTSRTTFRRRSVASGGGVHRTHWHAVRSWSKASLIPILPRAQSSRADRSGRTIPGSGMTPCLASARALTRRAEVGDDEKPNKGVAGGSAAKTAKPEPGGVDAHKGLIDWQVDGSCCREGRDRRAGSGGQAAMRGRTSSRGVMVALVAGNIGDGGEADHGEGHREMIGHWSGRQGRARFRTRTSRTGSCNKKKLSKAVATSSTSRNSGAEGRERRHRASGSQGPKGDKGDKGDSWPDALGGRLGCVEPQHDRLSERVPTLRSFHT